jgi:hypothetical protein
MQLAFWLKLKLYCLKGAFIFEYIEVGYNRPGAIALECAGPSAM